MGASVSGPERSQATWEPPTRLDRPASPSKSPEGSVSEGCRCVQSLLLGWSAGGKTARGC